MYRLFYVSTASAELHDEEVESLVNRAAVNNARLGISGALAFNGMNFAQVLEGEREAVLELMESIRNDKRHFGIVVVLEGARKDRRWDGWSMTRLDGMAFDPLVETALAD